MAIRDLMRKFTFKATVKRINKLSGSPFSNIPSWLYEKSKQITPNPLKPWKKKTIKEKKMHFPSLQKTLVGFRDKINSIVDMVNKIPEIEKKLYERLHNVESKLTTHEAKKIYIPAPRIGSTAGRSSRKQKRNVNDAHEIIRSTTTQSGGKLKEGGKTLGSKCNCNSRDPMWCADEGACNYAGDDWYLYQNELWEFGPDNGCSCPDVCNFPHYFRCWNLSGGIAQGEHPCTDPAEGNNCWQLFTPNTQSFGDGMDLPGPYWMDYPTPYVCEHESIG